MPIGEAAAVVTTLKNATEILQKLRNSASKADTEAGISALSEMLLDARGAALDLQEAKAALTDEISGLKDRVKALEAENRKLLEFSEDSQKYERVQTTAGMFVYRERQPAGSNAPMPYLCPNCFAEKKIRILQGTERSTHQHCHACNFNAVVRPINFS